MTGHAGPQAAGPGRPGPGAAGPRRSREVVVIGAGPTGLVLAVALRRYGLDVLVVDRAPDTKREARASVIWQRGLEALRDLGCADAFLEHGLPLTRGDFHVSGRPAGVQRMHMPDTAFPAPLSIEQDAVERLLRARLRELGPDVAWSTEATAVRVGAEGAAVDLLGPDGRTRTVDTRWVVGCEGSHSLVRRSLGLSFDGRRRSGLQCLQMNVHPRWSHPPASDRTRIFVNHRVTLITDPVPGGATRCYAFRDDPEPRRDGPPDVAEMTALVAAATGEPTVRLEPSDPRWANRARFHDRIAPVLRRGPALLAGDAAHLWAPIGGRGLNTGLLGAHNLGWKLAAVHRGWCPDALLDTYSAEQRRTALQVMRAMRHNPLELPPNRATLAALRVLLPRVLRNGPMERRGALALSDFARNHRGSALSAAPAPRTGPRPGDRLPDLPLADGGGLHGLLSYRSWSLLAVEGADGGSGAGRAAAVFHGLTGRYRLPVAVTRVRLRDGCRRVLPPGTLLLVRPDTHVALRTPAPDPSAVSAYLDRWALPHHG